MSSENEAKERIERSLFPEFDEPHSEPGSIPNGEDKEPEGISLDDFWSYMPMHNYIFAPARQHWPGSSVNARLPLVPLFYPDGSPKVNKHGEQIYQKPTTWLDINKPVEQMTWAPGLRMVIRDRLTSEGGWIPRRGVSCFNLYRPPPVIIGNPLRAQRWLDHVYRVYPDEAERIIHWLAHRVQRPAEKINHALVLGGAQGIGKDSLLEPVKRAVGAWNWADVSPREVLGRFSGFVKSVALRINEARDLGDVNRFQFYDHMKSLTAAPPDVLRVDEKHIREYYVMNCSGVIITTNHKTDGIYLPADDRRHFVCWSEEVKENFSPAYWDDLWS